MAVAPPSSRRRSWADMPPELAGEVLRLLPALVDRVRFAAVCPQWRAAARQLPRPPPPLPLAILKDGTFFSLPRKERFRLPGRAGGYHNVCGNWLICSRSHVFFMMDPLSRATMPLPQFHHPHQVEDFSEYAKVVWCSPDLIAASMGIRVTTQLAVCHPLDSSWSLTSEQYEWDGYCDIAFHQGKLYVLDRHQNLLAVEISEGNGALHPRVSQVIPVIGGASSDGHMASTTLLYLVESRGKLLLVRREVCYQIRLPACTSERKIIVNVFKANFERSQWVKVTTLGNDEALFLGRLCSGSVNVSRYDVPGDHIFFLDDAEDNDQLNKEFQLNEEFPWHDEKRSDALSVYSMKGGGIVSSPLPVIPWKDGQVANAWLFPQE